MASDQPAKKRGRPPGSIALTAEKENQLLTLVRGGASLRSAAETAEIGFRTLQEYLARGEGRSSKLSTPKLRRFARDLQRAQAEATASAEVRVHKNQPATWLKNTLTDLTSNAEDGEAPSPERIRELAGRVRDLLLLTDPLELVPRCPNPRCRCMFHRERTPEEVAVIRELAAKRAAS
jgi:hypothetical protein